MARAIRKTQRRHLIYYLKVIHAETGALVGRLVDISPVGMMLIGERPFELELEIPLRLILPAKPGEPESALDLLGETVWCHKDVNPDYYATGIQFLNPTGEAAATIKNIVETWGFQD